MPPLHSPLLGYAPARNLWERAVRPSSPGELGRTASSDFAGIISSPAGV